MVLGDADAYLCMFFRRITFGPPWATFSTRATPTNLFFRLYFVYCYFLTCADEDAAPPLKILRLLSLYKY